MQETSIFSDSPKQPHGAPVALNSTVPIWEVHESELKPFSNGDAAFKTTLTFLEDAEWLVLLRALVHLTYLLTQLLRLFFF